MELHAPPKRLTVRDQFVLGVFWLSLNAQSAALFPIVIPLQILLFLPPGPVGSAQQALLLGWISAAGAVVSLIMPPVFGMMSDNTRGSWGRRRPYIAAGALLLVLSALLLAVAGSIAIFVLALILEPGREQCRQCLLSSPPAGSRAEGAAWRGFRVYGADDYYWQYRQPGSGGLAAQPGQPDFHWKRCHTARCLALLRSNGHCLDPGRADHCYRRA